MRVTRPHLNIPNFHARWGRRGALSSRLRGNMTRSGTPAGVASQAEARPGSALDALRRSEERLRAIIETEPECVKILSTDGQLLEMNPSGLAMLEASSLAEARSMTLDQYVTPAYRPAFMGLFRKVLGGGSGRLEFEITGLRGTHRWLETSAVPLRDQAGSISGLLGVTRDVTARKRAERALAESEERFRALIERSSDLLLVVDVAGRITFASPAVVELLGPVEALQREPLERIHPEDRARLASTYAELLQRPGSSRDLTLQLKRRDGTWGRFEVVVRSLVDVPAVAGLVVNARDVTEQRHLQEQLAQAQKLECIGRLAGGVAHDFNNLLVSILGNADFLERGLGPDHPQLEEVREIRQAGERARDLTGQLLAVARRQIIAPRTVDLNEVVREAEKLLRRLIGEDVAVAVRLTPGPWSARADAGQLQQVLLNLAVNARDAMPRGGLLTLETENVVTTAAWAAAHPGAAPGPHVLLKVTDTGEGMSEEVQRHLFEPFFTTKAVGKGTGLGLATVYGIVKQAGGQITLRSRPGAGTTFEIHLPRATDPEAPSLVTPVRSRRHAGETILVVEDDAAVREVTVRALRQAGYQVLVAADPAHALRVYQGAPRPVDLLLTDLIMPGASGREVAAELTARQPALRVLYVSGYPQDAVSHRGTLERGAAFLPKPFTPASLLVKVGEVLDAPADRS